MKSPRPWVCAKQPRASYRSHGAGFEREQVEAEILMDRNSFALRPVEVGVNKETAACLEFGGGLGVNGFG